MRRVGAYPVTEANLMNFLAQRQASGTSVSSLRVSLQALRHYHVVSGYDTTVFASPRVKLLIQGALRTDTAQPTTRLRNGVTPSQLGAIASHLKGAPYTPHESAMLWSAVSLAYHGLLRVSEYTSTNVSKQLTMNRFHLTADTLTIELPFTKTCQYGQGKNISVARTDSLTCPVSAMASYLHQRGLAPGPVFVHQSGTPLRAAAVNDMLRRALPGQAISSHSLRIGGATVASSRGVSDQALKAAGRWSSNAYQRYVRVSDDDHRAVSRLLA